MRATAALNVSCPSMRISASPRLTRMWGAPRPNDTATTEIYTLSLRRFRSRWSPYHYCFQVASVVGLTIIHIFGFDTRSALPLAEKCGIAFQLTNILRDIREDAGLGRIYIPGEDLRRFGVTEDDLRE